MLQHPSRGDSVTVTLRITAPMRQTISATVRLRKVSRSAFDAPDGAGTFRSLRC